MPIMPKDQCAEYGCKQSSIPHSIYCESHAPKTVTSKDRKEFNSAYRAPSWNSIRCRQLSTVPLCQSCMAESRVTDASTVDHVFPWRKIGNHAFTRNLFQSLCVSCHSVKTGLERKGVFRHYATDGIIDLNVNDYVAHCRT